MAEGVRYLRWWLRETDGHTVFFTVFLAPLSAVGLFTSGKAGHLPTTLWAVGPVALATWFLVGPWFFRRRVARGAGGRHRSAVLPWNRAGRDRRRARDED